MTDEEVNKIIAEFMGEKIWEGILLYTESLDMLIPVWEKLNCSPMFNIYKGRVQCSLGFISERVIKNTYTLAAAYATAKAIKELK